MYARFYRAKRRLVVVLVHSRKIGGQARSEHIGPLGTVIASEPIALSERMRFWAQLPARLRAIHARFPGRISADDERKAVAAIDRRVPRLSDSEELRAAIEAAKAEASAGKRRRRNRGAATRGRAGADAPLRMTP